MSPQSVFSPITPVSDQYVTTGDGLLPLLPLPPPAVRAGHGKTIRILLNAALKEKLLRALWLQEGIIFDAL